MDNPSSKEATYECRAKVNLILKVVAKRRDGYHDIDSLMCTVDLADKVTFRWGGPGVSLTCSDRSLEGEANLAWKAAGLFLDAFGIDEGASIHIEKKIPVAAGLAGGSSDAACALNALASRYAPDVNPDVLSRLALEVGSDVPYLLSGGPARVRGRGEIVEPVARSAREALGALDLVAVTPAIEVRSSLAYESLGMGLTEEGEKASILGLDSAIADRYSLAGALENDLERGVSERFPVVRALKSGMMDMGALGAVMSGSGPTVLAIVENRAQAERMAERLAAEGHAAFALRTTDSAHSARE